eukprot:PITA_25163
MEDSCSSSSPPQSTEEGDLLSPSRHQCQSLINIVNEIAVIGDYRRTHRKDCMTLVRRIKLLMPLFEELKDMVSPPHEAFFSSVSSLEKALLSAKTLLQLCHDGSKLYLVLEREAIAGWFVQLTEELDQALDGLSYKQLKVSDEVREQVSV